MPIVYGRASDGASASRLGLFERDAWLGSLRLLGPTIINTTITGPSPILLAIKPLFPDFKNASSATENNNVSDNSL